MNHNEWKNQAIFGRLMESFGYKTLNEGDMVDNSTKEEAAEAEEAAAETKPAVTALEEGEELDEAHCGGRREDDTMEEGHGMCPTCMPNPCACPSMEEGAKPDFPDVDGDGDTKEPISKASKEKKEKEGDDKEDKDLSKVPPQLRKHVAKKKADEAMIREAVRKAIKKVIL